MEQKKESNYVFDECKDWFCKYQEAYQKLGDICSSKEGKAIISLLGLYYKVSFRVGSSHAIYFFFRFTFSKG